MIIVLYLGTKSLKFETPKSTVGIRQKEHSKFKVLRCSNKKSGSRASVWACTISVCLRLQNKGEKKDIKWIKKRNVW